MGFGIEIKNSNNEILIDSKYRNMSYYSSGYVEAYNSDEPFTEVGIPISNIPTTPLVCLRPSVGSYCVVTRIVPNSYLYIRCYGHVDYFCCCESYELDIESSYGMRIFSEDGNVVFDSRFSYLKIYATEIIQLSTSTPYMDISHENIENPFYVLSNPQHLFFIQKNGNIESWLFFFIAGLYRISSNTVRVLFLWDSQVTLPPGNTAPPTVYGTPMTLLIVNI